MFYSLFYNKKRPFYTTILLILLIPYLLCACSEKWEYLVVSDGEVYFEYDKKQPHAKTKKASFGESLETQKFLDALGKEGWELVDVVGIIGGDQEFIFKRNR